MSEIRYLLNGIDKNHENTYIVSIDGINVGQIYYSNKQWVSHHNDDGVIGENKMWIEAFHRFKRYDKEQIYAS